MGNWRRTTGVQLRPGMQRVMRFIVKAIFWFGIVLLFLPESALHDQPPRSTAEDASPREEPSFATGDIIMGLARLCGNNPEICARTTETLSVLSEENGPSQALQIWMDQGQDVPVPKPRPENN